MTTAASNDPAHDGYRYNGEDDEMSEYPNAWPFLSRMMKRNPVMQGEDDAEWRLLAEPTACEGHTHRFPNNAMVCTCGRIDRRKKMMQ